MKGTPFFLRIFEMTSLSFFLLSHFYHFFFQKILKIDMLFYPVYYLNKGKGLRETKRRRGWEGAGEIMASNAELSLISLG